MSESFTSMSVTQENNNISSKLNRSPLLALIEDPTRACLIKQGAEAVSRFRQDMPVSKPERLGLFLQKVYKIDSLFTSSPPQSHTNEPLLLKYRFRKLYRHETLDASLTKSRISHEAKCLARCKRMGVDVPGVRGIDMQAGILMLEWIEGYGSVREVLGGLPEEEEEEVVSDDEAKEEKPKEIEEIQKRLERLNLSEGELDHRQICTVMQKFTFLR